MIQKIQKHKARSTVDPEEISHFSSHAADWWDVNGTYAPLHKMAEARMKFISSAFGPLKGKSVLDIGCGGGLICEPLSRLGGKVTGVDADPHAIQVAREHALSHGVSVTYKNAAAEDLVAAGEKFDYLTALEIIEHVSSPMAFVGLCSDLLKPGGKVIFSTLNRTWKSYGLGIFVAERILSWAPEGTHNWNKFIKPSELARIAECSDLKVLQACGLVYKPLSGTFALNSHDLDINYFMVAEKIA
ncbi:MAG: bifunctional 2-polyprenyl-6-hydroxyphenol methylase/3-demethylubiquinol 3-O-methyltransferase UbiG [Pseudobdellovibrionaceae bacterium]|jgi:2-polyprenyl-6-hydroxyphenyl methylase/3-demethylubiquinone-9 3-methyltransferase|nr:bifunctional 2-polyprenyl-6-hydroxyphenol methylase/3-demethylubiquinol 3-O-methyltransferase UbiG [Pseudobdellovibrionaceae bacterium]